MTSEIEGVREDFEEAWLFYPKKIDKVDALRCYSARRKEGISASDLLEATQTYATVCHNEGKESIYVLRGATFYGPHERWRAYLPPEGDLTALIWYDYEMKGYWQDPWNGIRYTVSPDERGFSQP